MRVRAEVKLQCAVGVAAEIAFEKHASGARMKHANRKIDTRDDACGLISRRKLKHAEKLSMIDLETRVQYSYETL